MGPLLGLVLFAEFGSHKPVENLNVLQHRVAALSVISDGSYKSGIPRASAHARGVADDPR